MSGWLLPIHCTRRGASHARRDRPCQDASLCRRLQSADGQPVLVMAVADGHGASRHDRSDWGSRLACEQALAAVQSGMASRPLAAAGEALTWQQLSTLWLPWLREELPARIHAGWLEATERHWQENGGGGPFAADPYGTTLGLVVMTPHWWGRTGLGDWDLVRISDAGVARLIDHEGPLASSGETTLSLCLEQAAALCGTRAALEPIRPDGEAFSLMLCTDGIRKSCATDADFLTLAAWLSLAISAPGSAGGPGSSPDAPDLAAALDRISRDGSGDDVSLTLAHWSPAAAAAAGPSPISPTGPDQQRSAWISAAARSRAAEPAMPSPPPGADGERRRDRTRRRRHLPPAMRWLSLALLLMASAATSWLLLSRPANPPAEMPLSRRFRSPERRALQLEIERLCQQPQTMATALARRQTLFDSLAATPVGSKAGSPSTPAGPPPALNPTTLRDPLASLIELSRRPHSAGLPGLCAPLRTALAQQWERREAGLRPSRRR